PNQVYALYLHHGRIVKDAKPPYQVDPAVQPREIRLRLPAGIYSAVWRDPKSGAETKKEQFAVRRAGEAVALSSPPYAEDAALIVRAK
ncbi:MAG: hypothetical protein HY822_18410, partial [Acidobacteria bacterium]|nr:hypothetical protein [Acidobacteriota bacterium]